METVFSKQLQKLRKQSGITQEQLAAKLGVTAQAVSKWENGSYPDSDLLPKIADIFDVSIDNLYGRGEERCSFEQQVLNHMRAIADSSQDSSAEWLKNYLNIIWAMQLTAWRECRYYYDIPDFKDSNGTVASERTCNTGVTYMRLNKDFRYFTFIEQPESFAKQFSDIDKLSELFRFLGDKMNLKVVMYLLSLDNGEVVSASTIAIHLGYPKEKIEKAGGKISYMIEGASEPQKIEAAALDMAGNETTSEMHKVLVTSSVWIQYINNTPLLIGSILGIVLVAGGLIWFFVIRKKKEESK